jgi:hypothetical protein
MLQCDQRVAQGQLKALKNCQSHADPSMITERPGRGMEVRRAPRLPHVDRTLATHGWPILMAPNGFRRTFIVQDVGNV